MLKLLGVVLGLLALSGSAEDGFVDVEAAAETEITMTSLKLSSGDVIGTQVLTNQSALVLAEGDVVTVQATVCGGVTNSVKFYLSVVEVDGSTTLVRANIELFEPYALFGDRPVGSFFGSADVFEDGRFYVLTAGRPIERPPEGLGAPEASKTITFLANRGFTAATTPSIVDLLGDFGVDERLFGGNAWITFASFDFEDPARDVLNVGYPSAIAVYFSSIVPGNATWTFSGTFPSGEGVFHSSLVAYDEFGDIDLSYPPVFAFNSTDAVFRVAAKTPTFVLQRFYLEPGLFPLADVEDLLFRVSSADTGEVPFYDSTLRLLL
mmetsp:Transcript_451/g.1631  ORF Transcript_451/g.1631 Transcript_451/m.1631 type:complete len:322 (+) Transcript_451:84-1049(+)